MADGQYFRDLGHRFEQLRLERDPGEELAALYSETPQARYAAELGVNAKMAVYEGASDVAYAHAREAARAGRAALDGVAMRCHYCFSGPHDPATLRSLENQWSALATLGAVAARQADSSRQGWLDLLRTRSPYIHRSTGCSIIEGEAVETEVWHLERLCRASAEMCVVLESEAAIGGFTSLSAQSVISRQRRTPRPKTSPVLARNLTALRELSGLTVEQLADRVGVSRDAIIRHSQGAQRPQPEALAGYAQAFSLLFGTTVTTDDLFDPALMTRIESLPKR